MLFDLATGGHHPVYIQHLVKHWLNEDLPGKLDIVVSPQFLAKYSDIINLAVTCSQQNVRFVPITINECSDIRSQKLFVNKVFREWYLYRKYAKQLEADHCLIMYLDHLQLPLALGAKSPCPFSGIYFRPTFHYDEFDNYVPSWKDRMRQWRQKLLLSRVLQSSQLKVLFCLDPFAVEHIHRLHSKVKILHLPDPVPIYDDENSKVESKGEQLRARLGIHRGRRVFLLFGSLNSRKGIYQLIEAVRLLPPTICKNLCLLLVGSISPLDKLLIKTRLTEISQSLCVQTITCDEFIPDTEVQLYFQIADVILAPYQRHVGMSGILILAAAVQKPVLASDYGLMGEITRRYELGLAVDSTEPHSIAQGLTRFMLESPERFCNYFKMKQFAEANDAKNFSFTVFVNINY